MCCVFSAALLPGRPHISPSLLYYLCKLSSRRKIHKQKRAQILTDQMHKSSQREHTWVSGTQIQKENLTLKVLLVPLWAPCSTLGLPLPLFSAPHIDSSCLWMICAWKRTVCSPSLASFSCRGGSLWLVSHLSSVIRNILQLYTRPFFSPPHGWAFELFLVRGFYK